MLPQPHTIGGGKRGPSPNGSPCREPPPPRLTGGDDDGPGRRTPSGSFPMRPPFSPYSGFGIELRATTSTQSSASFITASAKADVTAHL
jgi:hypothetical protein